MQGADVSRDVIGLDLRQTHIRHLSVRIEQERHQTRFTEIRPIGDFLEGRRIRVSMALVGGDDMACCAPSHRYPLAVGDVRGEDGRRHDRGKDSKSDSKKRSTLTDSSSADELIMPRVPGLQQDICGSRDPPAMRKIKSTKPIPKAPGFRWHVGAQLWTEGHAPGVEAQDLTLDLPFFDPDQCAQLRI
jgi:hypothetical protein